MKLSLVVMVFMSYSLSAMDKNSEPKKEVCGDEIIEMGSCKGYKKPIYLKEVYIPQSNDDFDIELSNMQYGQGYNDRAEYKKILLSELPIFQGHATDEISELMKQIEIRSPKKFGEITEALSASYISFKNRAKHNRALRDIDPKEVININDKIQYALLEVHTENQKIAEQNRQEDLAQAGKDRMRTTVISIASMVLSVPALTLAIINIIKAYH